MKTYPRSFFYALKSPHLFPSSKLINRRERVAATTTTPSRYWQGKHPHDNLLIIKKFKSNEKRRFVSKR
jgi:hypothetical protein